MTVKCIVPVSGGKDSQACLKLALLFYDKSEIVGLFCDTQFEHPITYAHVDRMREIYGVKIQTVTGGSVDDKVRKHGRWPSFGARHCTDELKIRETKIFLRDMAASQGAGFEVWYGVRSGESHARRKRYAHRISTETYAPHECMPGKYPKYLAKVGIRFRYPVLDWSTDEVLHFVGDELNPLYAAGFDRVGCFPCMAAGDGPKRRAFEFDDFGHQQHRRVIRIASEIGKSPWQEDNRGAGCSICSI